MKVRVCYEHGQYYVEYYKLWMWWVYTEAFDSLENTTVYFSTKQDAIDFAKQLACDTVDSKSYPKVVWESE